MLSRLYLLAGLECLCLRFAAVVECSRFPPKILGIWGLRGECEGQEGKRIPLSSKHALLNRVHVENAQEMSLLSAVNEKH